jgi:hypothetical protein
VDNRCHRRVTTHIIPQGSEIDNIPEGSGKLWPSGGDFWVNAKEKWNKKDYFFKEKWLVEYG